MSGSQNKMTKTLVTAVLSVLADGWKLTPLLLRRGRICPPPQKKKKLHNGIIFYSDEKGLMTGEIHGWGGGLGSGISKGHLTESENSNFYSKHSSSDHTRRHDLS